MTNHTVDADSHDLYANTAPDEPAGKDTDYGDNPDHDAMPTSTNAEADDKGNSPHLEPSEATSVWTLLEPLPPGWLQYVFIAGTIV